MKHRDCSLKGDGAALPDFVNTALVEESVTQDEIEFWDIVLEHEMWEQAWAWEVLDQGIICIN